MNKQKNFFSSQRNRTTMLIFGLVVLFLMLVSPVWAALDTGLSYGTATGLSTQDIRVTIMRIIQIFLGLVGIIAIVIIIYAGYIWMTSAGNAEKIDQAKRILRNAAIGLLIIFSAFSIVSFIINMLQDSFRPGGPGGTVQPPIGCENCGHLGNGIIQSVYPLPLARDVARNTKIMVTFKVKMKPDTLIKEAAEACSVAAPCSGLVNADNVKIYPYIYKLSEAEIDKNKLTNVSASSVDGLTFTFQPVQYLGDGTNNVWYAVKLGNGVKKDNGDTAFPGSSNYFMWRFEIGTHLDLDPVENSGVFPQPDNEADKYSATIGTAAIAQITITGTPRTYSGATVSAVRRAPTYACADGIDNNSNGKIDMADPACSAANMDGESPSAMPKIVTNGNYNGTYNGKVTLLLNSGATKTSAAATWSPLRDGAPSSYTIANNTLTLGDGITLSFINPSNGADQWEVTLTSFTQPDGLRIANKVYTFGTDIAVGAPAVTAGNIQKKIAADSLTPPITAVLDGNKVTLTSGIIGHAGNFMVDTKPSGADWATISTTIGSDSELNSTANDAADKPRNTIITIDFNEPIDPIAAQAGTAIKVQYNSNSNPTQTPTWTDVAGKFLVSNQYQTVEFIPENQCKICYGGTKDGQACSESLTCGGGSCESVKNSCGDKVYCLPALADIDATKYRVFIKAGKLKDCDDAEKKCTDPGFTTCVAAADGSKVCQGVFGTAPDTVNAFYPQAANPAGGLTDAANNSFNGNNNIYAMASGSIFGRAEGPGYIDVNTEIGNQSGKPAYALNKVCSNDQTKYCSSDSTCGSGNKCVNLPDSQGDDLIWYFFINKGLKLTPANLVSVGPNIAANGVSLTLPVEAAFDQVMMSSTLKSGSNYRDGYCYCDPSTESKDCNTKQGETCQDNKCKNETTQTFCEQNSDCGSKRCLNKRYVTLVNPSTFQVGWWVGKRDIDLPPLDTYADRTQTLLFHTKLAEVTDYGTEIGSGIQDVYQNCYLPSEGPKALNGNCNLTKTTACNLNSDCPTGETCDSYTHCSATTNLACTGDLDCPVGQHCINFCDLASNPGSCCQVSRTEPYCCNGSKSAIPCRHCKTTTAIGCDNKDDCPSGEECVQ
ncbi:MAG: hypothetical protein WC508_01300 [Patescibacteria group bacterium]